MLVLVLLDVVEQLLGEVYVFFCGFFDVFCFEFFQLCFDGVVVVYQVVVVGDLDVQVWVGVEFEDQWVFFLVENYVYVDVVEV